MIEKDKIKSKILRLQKRLGTSLEKETDINEVILACHQLANLVTVEILRSDLEKIKCNGQKQESIR